MALQEHRFFRNHRDLARIHQSGLVHKKIATTGANTSELTHHHIARDTTKIIPNAERRGLHENIHRLFK